MSSLTFVSGPALPTRELRKPNVCSVRMGDTKLTRRAALGAALTAAAAWFAPKVANAEREYGNVGFLGGGDVVDINNANVRVYVKFPGMYPTLAGLIVSNGPYKSVDELYNLPLTSTQRATLDKYKNNLTALAPTPEYVRFTCTMQPVTTANLWCSVS